MPDLRKRRSGVSAVAHLSHAKSATLARRSGERELHGIPRAVDVAGHQVPVRVERLADRLVAEQPLHGLAASHLAQRFKELIGVTPKRLARTYRFAATVFSMSRSNSYKSASSPISNLRASQSRGEPCGQGGHVQLGVGGRLRRGRE